MAAPKFWRNKRILFALESTYGVDPGPKRSEHRAQVEGVQNFKES